MSHPMDAPPGRPKAHRNQPQAIERDLNPVAIRREFLAAAQWSATKQPTGESLAHLLACTEALLSVLTDDPDVKLDIISGKG